jgi:hypothetical protein
MIVTHFHELGSVCDRRELADYHCRQKKSVKILAFIVVAIKVNGKTCITNWYVILTLQRGVTSAARVAKSPPVVE